MFRPRVIAIGFDANAINIHPPHWAQALLILVIMKHTVSAVSPAQQQDRIGASSTSVHTKIAVAVAAAFVLSQGVFAQSEPVADQILTRPSGHLTETGVQAIFNVHGASQIQSIAQLNVRILQVPAARRDLVIEALQHNPNIEFAEVTALASLGALTNDFYVTNGYEWHLNKIQASDAWGITSGNASTIIAICDTGVAPTQPDLLGKLLPGYNFYANNRHIG
jgi:hypothetical protein